MTTRTMLVLTMVLAVAVCISPVLAASTQPVVLQLKGQVGDQAQYRTDLDFAVDLEINDPSGGLSVTVKPRLNGWVTSSEKVAAVSPAGDLTMTGRIDAFDLRFDVANLHLRAAVDPGAGGLGQLIKLPEIPVRAVVSKRGQVIGLQGLDKLPIPPLPGPGGAKINLAEMINQVLSKYSQPILADRPVSVGETWTVESAVNLAEMMKSLGMPLPVGTEQQMGKLDLSLKTTYAFRGYEVVKGQEAAVIEANSPWKIEFPVGDPKAAKGLLTETGSTVMTIHLVPTTGKVVRERVEFALEMTVQDQGATPAHMTMRATVVQDAL